MQLDYRKILTVLVIIGAFVLMFYIGRWTKPCGQTNPTGGFTSIETHYQDLKPEPNIRIDTVPGKPIVVYKNKYVTIEDSAAIKQLLIEKDSLIMLLQDYAITELAVLDTVLKPAGDTLQIEYDIYDEKWNRIYLGFAARTVPVQKEFIYLPAPKREWWDNPLVGCLGGFILGGISGILIGVSVK
jgi:hypothetical protein